MKPRQLAKLSLSLLRHPVYTGFALFARNRPDGVDLRRSLRRCADWLLRAQHQAPDGAGYSRRFRLTGGWDRCYVETTGYIIPSLIDVAAILGDARYARSAATAADWLLTVQAPDGSFADVDRNTPHAFDTGQVLIGLNRMYLETGDERFKESALRAANWLASVQEKDGSWLRFAYNGRPHAYYSRVAAALIETGRLHAVPRFMEAGRRNLEWVLSKEQPNGYFRYSEFREGQDPFLHTIVYVLEGFGMAFELTEERRWRDTLVRGAGVLRRLANSDGLLCSQYDSDWRATNTEYCVTGLAQFAGVCFDVFRLTDDPGFFDIGRRVVQRLCEWQLVRGADTMGALPSSIPVWGAYGGMELYNWNCKFFADAIVKYLRLKDGHEVAAAAPAGRRDEASTKTRSDHQQEARKSLS
jgi:hypothetical protein